MDKTWFFSARSAALEQGHFRRSADPCQTEAGSRLAFCQSRPVNKGQPGVRCGRVREAWGKSKGCVLAPHFTRTWCIISCSQAQTPGSCYSSVRHSLHPECQTRRLRNDMGLEPSPPSGSRHPEQQPVTRPGKAATIQRVCRGVALSVVVVVVISEWVVNPPPAVPPRPERFTVCDRPS